MVLLGVIELFGRFFKVFIWNIGDCLFFDEVIKNNFIRLDFICVRDFGVLRKFWFGSIRFSYRGLLSVYL